MVRKFTSSIGASRTGPIHSIVEAIKQNSFDSIAQATNLEQAEQQLAALAGTESFGFLPNAGNKQQLFATATAIRESINGGGINIPENLLKTANDFAKASVTGFEGFSNPQELGKSVSMKATNIALNSLSHAQTDAAEEMYKTITLSHDQENFTINVRSAGLGRYVYGATAFDSASELTPIMSLIRSGKFFLDDTTVLNPVYPADDDAAILSLFVDKATFEPWTVGYSKSDALGREEHDTSFIKAGSKINNLLGLCQTPTQRVFDSSDDEIESASLSINRVLLNLNIDGTNTLVSYDVNNLPSSTFTVTNQGHSSDDRSLNLNIADKTAAAFEKWDDSTKAWVADDKVAALNTGAYVCHFAFRVNGTFWRQGYSLDTSVGEVRLEFVTDAEGVRYYRNTKNSAVKAIFERYKGGKVEGFTLNIFHNNLNRTNFGYRIELHDTPKIFTTRIHTPISLKYPIEKEDQNQQALTDAADWVLTTIQAQTTNAAFAAAEKHIENITRIRNTGIVGNIHGSDIMPGAHFLNPTYVERTIALKDSVSTKDNVDMLANVQALFTNNITEICGALETNSSLAAISEYRKVEVKWVAVGHQNLTRYLMRNGDTRVAGAGVSCKIVNSCLDTMIGKFYLFPESNTSGTNIDVVGGMGIMTSREHRVFQANVTRNNSDFGIMVTIPYYQHHSVCPVLGQLIISDAKEALTDEGLLNYLNAQRVKLVDADGKSLVITGGKAAGDDADGASTGGNTGAGTGDAPVDGGTMP